MNCGKCLQQNRSKHSKTTMLWLYFLLSAIAGVLFHQFYWRRRNLPPGPFPLPFFGNMLYFTRSPHDLKDSMNELAKKYGDIYTMWFGPEPFVMLNDYETIKETVIKHGDMFETRPDAMMGFEIMHGGKYGIIATSGDRWKEQRRFSLHVLRDFGVGRSLMEDRVIDETNYLIQACQKAIVENDGVLKPYESLQKCVGNVINNLMFGHRFEENDPTLTTFKNSLDDFQNLSGHPLALAMNYSVTRKIFIFNTIWKRFDAFVNSTFGLMEREIAEHHRNFDADAEPVDYVGAYLKEMKLKQAAGDTGSFSDRQLRSVVFDIWFAGLDTTVTTLHWAVLYLLHYPEYQQKIHEELDAVVGRDHEIRMTDKNNLPYTMAFIQETQRYANILPINLMRRLEQDMTIMGHKLLAGTTLVPQISAVMSDKRYFPEPARFDPGRFVEDGNLKKVEQLIPFSVGKRSCMGEALARMELFIIFANFTQKFIVSKAPGAPYPHIGYLDKFSNKAIDFSCKLTARK